MSAGFPSAPAGYNKTSTSDMRMSCAFHRRNKDDTSLEGSAEFRGFLTRNQGGKSIENELKNYSF